MAPSCMPQTSRVVLHQCAAGTDSKEGASKSEQMGAVIWEGHKAALLYSSIHLCVCVRACVHVCVCVCVCVCVHPLHSLVLPDEFQLISGIRSEGLLRRHDLTLWQ